MTHHGALLLLVWCAVAAVAIGSLAWEEWKIDRRER